MDLLFAAAAALGSPDALQDPAVASSSSYFSSSSSSSSSSSAPPPTLTSFHRKRVTYHDLPRHVHDHRDLRAVALHRVLSKPLRTVCVREFFYSAIDAEYYEDNEFIRCLELLGLGHLRTCTRFEWSIVRGVMGVKIGRPRRFSRA